MSKLNPQQLEIVRVSLLRYIQAGEGVVSSSYLLQFVRAEGFRSFDNTELNAALSYLQDKKLIAKVDKLVSPENPHWMITADGVDFLALN
jgi:hypothetical protein